MHRGVSVGEVQASRVGAAKGLVVFPVSPVISTPVWPPDIRGNCTGACRAVGVGPRRPCSRQANVFPDHKRVAGAIRNSLKAQLAFVIHAVENAVALVVPVKRPIGARVAPIGFEALARAPVIAPVGTHDAFVTRQANWHPLQVAHVESRARAKAGVARADKKCDGAVCHAALAQRFIWDAALLVKLLLLDKRSQPRQPAPVRSVATVVPGPDESVVRETALIVVIVVDRQPDLT